jgi:hypothetical protein
MRSSIFSFSQAPEGPWFRTWLLAAGLIAVSLVSWEATLRCLGYRPSVIDDPVLWAVQRDRVYGDHGKKAVVLLGDCRIRLDCVPRLLAQQFPGHPIAQLGVEGTSPVATLLDLASDERFNGLVICAVNPRMLCEDMWPTQQPYVDYYHTQYTLNAKLNRIVSATLQQHLACLYPASRLDNILTQVLETRQLPSPYYVETHADRSRLADYSRVSVNDLRQSALDWEHSLCDDRQLPSPENWLREVMTLDDSVRAIQRRGGDVIFIQFPTTHKLLHYSEFVLPKAKYWDAFAAKSSALCLHFKDVPELADFPCPDWSHLDRRDAPRFTLRLATLLKERGLFNPSACASTCEKADKNAHTCHCPDHGKRLLMHDPCPCCSAKVPC